MFFVGSLINSLKEVAFGKDGKDTGPLEDNEEVPVIIPRVKSSLGATRGRPPVLARIPANEKDDMIERIKNTGEITALDNLMLAGVIDRTYRFDMTKFCTGNQIPYTRGTKVEFEAERSRHNPQWRVISMKVSESTQKVISEMNKSTKVIGMVKSVDKDKIQVETIQNNSSTRIITLPNTEEFHPGFLWIKGDWIQIHLKQIYATEIFGIGDDDLPVDLTSAQVLSVAPLEEKTTVGKVSKRNHNFLIDNSVFYKKELFDYKFLVGTVVRCKVIQSSQYIGDENLVFVNWRAVEIERSNFLHYCAPDANGAKEEEAVVRHHENLTLDKHGIRIRPKVLRFPITMIEHSMRRTMTIYNDSSKFRTLKEVRFTQDPSVCQIKVKCSYHRYHEDNEDVIIKPKSEIQFEIYCKPMMIGKTTEMCTFEFDGFVITRELSIVGLSEEEKNLTIDLFQERPQFKKQVGERDISKIVIDQARRRIRGNQIVRTPFFIQKRLPLTKTPGELLDIIKHQDEAELRRKYPAAMRTLEFDNYKEKFMVSLWFEEIENDFRRRQYDLSDVILNKHCHENSIYYTFNVQGLSDFQPPINVQDTIDVFDEGSPSSNTSTYHRLQTIYNLFNDYQEKIIMATFILPKPDAKFQGTITKVCETELTCVFGDAFDSQYCETPITVQFNLGRSNYKRCHYANQTAVDFLGEDFLFPKDTIVLKPPRIVTFEGDILESLDNVGKEDMKMNPSDYQPRKSTRFSRFAQSLFKFGGSGGDANSNSPNSVTMVYGRRAPSVRSRFISDTVSSPSCRVAKLEWFNSQLNEEQKNAVRQILGAQARPLPYIIYGPPGTGKTVTLVEAVMQVNKLDKNSRVLVCAPSNFASDVIAEYMAKSGQFRPGDFIRLNGFLRPVKSVPEAILPFCMNGESLNKVAMQRLIVATCMTAGQFFSLDLSAGHFTHVFIDEAGYCTEPETMVPTILLALGKGGQLILAGDPKQLGPVLMSDISQNCGLNISFLERLMARKLYSRDPEQFPVEKYNPFVLTKLVRNYRAHAALLKLPSSLFYDNDLLPEAPFEEAYALCENPGIKSLLVSEGVPLIFHGIQGGCLKEADSPSWCNKAEAVQVAKYVSTLIGRCDMTPQDIGIITPYRKQVEKIRLALQLFGICDKLPKVASVEEFQGGERKVIIISTVRSAQQEKIDESLLQRLGFLYQPKRFNVVITRAKALMIVLGNPHLLYRNNFWRQLLEYVLQLNAYKGCNLPIELNQYWAQPTLEEDTEFLEEYLNDDDDVDEVDLESWDDKIKDQDFEITNSDDEFHQISL